MHLKLHIAFEELELQDFLEKNLLLEIFEGLLTCKCDSLHSVTFIVMPGITENALKFDVVVNHHCGFKVPNFTSLF